MTAAHKLTLLGAIGLFLNLFAAVSLMGITIDVTNTLNTDSPGSIRRAISDANDNPAISVIDLEPIQLDAYPSQAVINLTTRLGINTDQNLMIRANPSLPRPVLRSSTGTERIISLSNFINGTLRLENLEFRDGFADSLGGGAIYHQRNTSPSELNFHLWIENCHFENNVVNVSSGNEAFGGAIRFNVRSDANGEAYLTVTDSAFVGNQVIGRETFGNIRGSAIFVGGGHFRLRSSLFESNSSNAFLLHHGGAVALVGEVKGHNLGNPTSEIEISNSKFIFNEFMGNAAGATAISFYQTATQTEDTRLRVDRCYFSGNGLEGASGPAIFVGKYLDGGDPTDTKGILRVRSSFFARNEGKTASVLRDGEEAEVSFIHCSIVDNRHLDNFGAALVVSRSDSSLTLDRSLVALNSHKGMSQLSTFSPDIFPGSSSLVEIISLGYNFIGSAQSLSSSIFQLSDQLGTNAAPLDPVLGELADYGDGIQIMPPLAGGPLTEKIPGPYGFLDPLRIDVRGNFRNWNRNDIGAVQLFRETYDLWASSSGLPEGDDRSPDTDYSGDGLSNRMSFFLGLDPTVFNANPVSVFPDPGGLLTPSSDNLFLEFVRSKRAGFDSEAANGISIWQLESSEDLESWVAFDGIPELSLIESGSAEYVKYRYTIDPVEADRQFFRLRVE